MCLSGDFNKNGDLIWVGRCCPSRTSLYRKANLIASVSVLLQFDEEASWQNL